MRVLGIETSCDETGISLAEADQNGIRVLSNVISSQVKIHARWGGIVPNLAAREHVKNIIPVLEKVFAESQASVEEIDLIAVTNGPGLIPALLIGTSAAKTLSYVWKKPLLGIHHIEGHIYANFIGANFKSTKSGFNFPVLCLVVSGGHTQLVLMKNHLQYKIVGQTLDDAAGEAFDKVARILGLGYPGGPAVSRLAAERKSEIANAKNQKELKSSIYLPRPMLNKNNFNFSFSGLKTAVLYKFKELEKNKKTKDSDSRLPIAEMAHEFQQAVIDVLVAKTIRAARQYGAKTVMLAGGVSANQELRGQLKEEVEKNLPDVEYSLPVFDYCVDNAAMIAAAACFRWSKMNAREKKKARENWKRLKTDAGLKLQSLKNNSR